jgi:hypothetical protein
LDTCYKLLDTTEFVKYDESNATCLDRNISGILQPASYAVLSNYKTTQIRKANDCVHMINEKYNTKPINKDDIANMTTKINKYQSEDNIMIKNKLKSMQLCQAFVE